MTLSDSSGRFRAVFRLQFSVPPSSCLVAYAIPPPETDLLQSDEVSFDLDFTYDTPPDSVQVDLALR